MRVRPRKVAAITFDTDWIGPEAVAYIQKHLIPRELPTTWFVTGAYPSLAGFEPAVLEKAIHVDFKHASTMEARVRAALRFAPESIGYRGHSLFWSERLRPVFRANRIVYDSSMLLYREPDIRPYIAGYDIVELPVYFMDMFHLEYCALSGRPAFGKECLRFPGDGLKIFDFHPVHLLLNTPDQSYYFSRKKFYHTTSALLKQKFKGYGMENFFRDVIRSLSRQGYTFCTLKTLVARA